MAQDRIKRRVAVVYCEVSLPLASTSLPKFLEGSLSIIVKKRGGRLPVCLSGNISNQKRRKVCQ